MPNLPDLPVEIHGIIAKNLSDDDILSINHTNSELHTKTRFEYASRFLTDLAFPFSKTGAEDMRTSSLDDRRRYVKTIVVVLTVENHPRALEYLEAIILNLEAFYNLNSIGLRREFDDKIIPKYDSTYNAVSSRLKDVFLQATTDFHLPLRNIIFEVVAPDLIRPIRQNSDKVYMSQLERELRYTSGLVSAIHNQQANDVDLTIRFVKEGTAGTPKSPTITHSRQRSSMVGNGLSLNHILGMTPWMKTKLGFKEVILLNSEFDYAAFQEVFSFTSLEKLTLRNVRLLDRRLRLGAPWVHFLSILRFFPVLEYCQLGQLWHRNKVSFSGSTWQTTNRPDTLSLLHDLGTKKRSRFAFKLETAALHKIPIKKQKNKSKAKSKRWTKVKVKAKK
ncbi:hypothetical protein E4T42_00673 [Aureobasidium subglaciale]|nr:hypothetical protein E4T42_00673 [Aureobasidium subglaciale]